MTPPLRWLSAQDCDPPHRVTHPEKVWALAADLLERGWALDCPVLLGYGVDGRVQLVSGSHRWAACDLLARPLPVLVYPVEHFADLYGRDAWVTFLASPPILRQFREAA